MFVGIVRLQLYSPQEISFTSWIINTTSMEAVKEKVGGFGLSRRDSRTFIHEFAFRVSYMGFCVNYRGGIELSLIHI